MENTRGAGSLAGPSDPARVYDSEKPPLLLLLLLLTPASVSAHSEHSWQPVTPVQTSPIGLPQRTHTRTHLSEKGQESRGAAAGAVTLSTQSQACASASTHCPPRCSSGKRKLSAPANQPTPAGIRLRERQPAPPAPTPTETNTALKLL